MLTIVITGLVLMRAQSLSEALSSSSDVWKEWELRGVVFLSLALQIVLIFLGSCRKYCPYAWIKVVTWSAYLLADSIAIYAIGMITNMIREIKAGKSLSNPHTELSTFWAPFLLLHLGGPDTISAYAIEDNELWLRHLLTLVNQAGLTVYVLVMAWTHPTLSFLAILILLLGIYNYGERVWVLRVASDEHFKDSLPESQPRRKDSDKIKAEYVLKEKEGYKLTPHRVIDVDNEDAIKINDAIAKFPSEKPSSGKDLEDQVYKRVVGTLLSASHLVHMSQRLFADQLFSMEERDNRLSILSSKHCTGDFKVIEIELGLIFDMFYSKANAVYTSWGFICRLTILFSISAIFIELYALAHVLFSDQVACWLIKKNQLAVFCFINRIKPLLKRRRWSNSMRQYNLMSLKNSYSRWWKFLKLLHVDEMVIKEKEATDVQELPFPKIDRGLHALEAHKLRGQLEWSIKELDFDMSILVWHIATELCYYLNDGLDNTKELERNNRSPVKKKSLMGLQLSRYMLYLQYMCPSMLPARMGSIRFRDIYKKLSDRFPWPKARGRNRREPLITVAREKLLHQMKELSNGSASDEDKVNYVLSKGCQVALVLEDVSRWWRWEVIKEVWVEMLIHAAPKCKARDHARHMRGGGELINHVWLLMAHYGLTDHFPKPHPLAIAEIIVNRW
ncbi:hypothetical protein ACJRO7_005569 [Eucalyptus globulus]|uniref:DUF4220 domain-containing protein n=1 Tax=Eucalyptus globulus TaxID=34317 RepID=A0ABD3J726_EUCGL